MQKLRFSQFGVISHSQLKRMLVTIWCGVVTIGWICTQLKLLLTVYRALVSLSLSLTPMWSAVSVSLWLPEIKPFTNYVRAFPSWYGRLELENVLCGTGVENLPQWAPGVSKHRVGFFGKDFLILRCTGGIFLLDLHFKELRHCLKIVCSWDIKVVFEFERVSATLPSSGASEWNWCLEEKITAEFSKLAWRWLGAGRAYLAL